LTGCGKVVSDGCKILYSGRENQIYQEEMAFLCSLIIIKKLHSLKQFASIIVGISHD